MKPISRKTLNLAYTLDAAHARGMITAGGLAT